MISRLLGAYLKLPSFPGKYLIARLLFKFAHGSAIKTPYGVTMRCDCQDATNFYALSGQPDVDYRDVYQEVAKLLPGMAFIDVGANAGLFSSVAGKILGDTGPVIAFEPSLCSFSRLLDNAVLNGLTEFYPFRIALSDRTGSARLTVNTSHSGISHLTENVGDPVITTTYSDIAPLIGHLMASRDIFIKIDVEGAEFLVVQALRDLISLHRVKTIIIEIDVDHLKRFDATPEMIYSALAEAGFRPERGISTGSHFNEIFNRC